MKIAGVQMDVTIGAVDRNLDRIVGALRETRAAGAELTIFPECAATGYCFDSKAAALPFAQPVSGSVVARLTEACRALGGFVACGMLESDGGRLFNAAVLVGPDGLIGSYRKLHLPFLGIDMFVDYGDRPFAVHEAGGLRIGLQICYDSAFPEASRVHALLGADLVALPTNWPPGAECVSEHVIAARAMENAIYLAAVNRVGTENGFRFIGGSRICAPDGSTLASAAHADEAILYAEVDPAWARNKRVVRVPGRHAIDRLADRRPEMYGALVEPHLLERPGRSP